MGTQGHGHVYPESCSHAIVPYMLRQNYGRIVNVASIAGKEGNPNTTAYSASYPRYVINICRIWLIICSGTILLNNSERSRKR
ncbi:SDR family NAD(P)-dependent oxidoreductase [Alloacidobacterium sp.]|uniref:SDR family NAD(P)-dependent oxidoreductase n=1 Tax=Alloacidobacterium sp. TaxID=2951999 RepID=UPI002D343DD6|nr:SDR family NAD(P)-dependent oxidoreductase [Alloacidobacterium sp.]HYK37288.1 SDR family NAD(P)-dependent oxidoreductase [Alloacidobacterium sp.]